MITCILIEKGPVYPSQIIERLDTGFFNEVIIQKNCPSVYQRYVLAYQAKNDIIYVQDSDCFVNYQFLANFYNGRITNTMTAPFQKFYEPLQCTLVGWGCYFPKTMLNVFEKYISRYGEDAHLLREADRIFTYLNWPFNTILMPHEDILQDENRMSSPNNVKFHFQSAFEALKKCSIL